MAAFHGIIVYEILEHGNLLNAVYTNTGLLDPATSRYHIDNEIARRTAGVRNGVGGVYDCRYIEHGQPKIITAQLTINQRGEVYELEWVDGTTPIWKGIGLMAGERHLAVSYTEP